MVLEWWPICPKRRLLNTLPILDIDFSLSPLSTVQSSLCVTRAATLPSKHANHILTPHLPLPPPTLTPVYVYLPQLPFPPPPGSSMISRGLTARQKLYCGVLATLLLSTSSAHATAPGQPDLHVSKANHGDASPFPLSGNSTLPQITSTPQVIYPTASASTQAKVDQGLKSLLKTARHIYYEPTDEIEEVAAGEY